MKIESNRLLGTPIALPEGRPEDLEIPPLGFTPTGTPFYSEEERDRLMTKEAAPVELSPTKAPAAEVPAKTPPAAEETGPKKEETKEPTEEKPLDLDF